MNEVRILASIKNTKDTFDYMTSQEKLPREEDVLHQLQGLGCCQDWSELNDLLLTADELMRAGARQKDMHFLHGMPLALTDASADTGSVNTT